MNMPKCSTCRRWKKEYWCIDCNYEAKDLVDVVRCKDCKHFYGYEPDAEYDGWCSLDRVTDVNKEDFCSRAERKEQ